MGRLLARKAARLTEAEAVVRPILDAVRKRGDRALLEYARRFDGLERASVRVPEMELLDAAKKLDSKRHGPGTDHSRRGTPHQNLPSRISCAFSR